MRSRLASGPWYLASVRKVAVAASTDGADYTRGWRKPEMHPPEISGARQGDAPLALVLAATVTVRDLADLVGLEEQHLGAALAGVDLGRQRRGVGKLQRHIAFPLRLEGRHVHDDSAARIRVLVQADGEHVARNAEIFHGARQRKAVGRNDANLALEIDKALFVKVLRVHHRAVNVGEYLEFRRAANVIAIAGSAVADDLAPVHLPHLARLERLDHAVLLGHAADPFVAFDAHEKNLRQKGNSFCRRPAMPEGRLLMSWLCIPAHGQARPTARS